MDTERRSKLEAMPGLLDLKRGIIADPGVAKEGGVAQLKMPDGSIIELPVLLDSNGANFVDIRKLQPT